MATAQERLQFTGGDSDEGNAWRIGLNFDQGYAQVVVEKVGSGAVYFYPDSTSMRAMADAFTAIAEALRSAA